MNDIKRKINELVKEYYEEHMIKKSTIAHVSAKVFDEKELISVVDALLDGWWTDGKFTKKFEEKLSRFLGVKNAVVVNSGSSANLLAMICLTSRSLGERRLKQGDEVITVAAGFPTTINPIVQAGCIPVFCDVDIGTYNIKVEDMKKALSPKSKAIILAHSLGNPFNVKAVKEVCEKHNLWFIEDNCDGLGSKYAGKRTGSFGDMSTCSFYPAHHITMAEGGAICTDNDELTRLIRRFRDWGRDCYCATGEDNTCGNRYNLQLGKLPLGYDHKYIFSEIGYNLKNTDLNVALGIPQLDKLPGFIEDRKKNYKLLYEGLKSLDDTFIMPIAEKDSDPCWFGFPLTIKEGDKFKRKELLEHLEQNKIGNRLLFAGNVTKQPYFINNEVKYRMLGELKNTDVIMNNTFWIGVTPKLTEENIRHIIKTIKEFVKKYK